MYPVFTKNRQNLSTLIFFIPFALCLNAVTVRAQTNVLTQHNNLGRTGWNNTETQLKQANVSAGNFGKLFTRTVDDQVYAQPLVYSKVKIGGGTHNIVIVATVNNSVYAYDADTASITKPYWQVSLTYNPGGTNAYRSPKNTDETGACGGNYKDFAGNFGIVGTPVIDSTTNTMYVVARSVTQNGLTFVQYLHALDVTTGAEKAGSPVSITASVPGTGDGSVSGTLSFDEERENPRPGLLLYNGVVYISWASHCDWSPYHGWIIGYDKTTLAQKYVYNDSPNGSEAGIWMSGQAPAVDANGFMYVVVGNGTVGSGSNPNDTTERGESLLKLSTASGKLKVVDFFTPDDYVYLNNEDLDYGSDGAMLIPNTTLSLSGSKESYLYLINNSSMGGYNATNANVKEMLNINASSTASDKHIHGSAVYFENHAKDEYIYAWAEGGLLKQFPFIRSTGLFDTLNQIVGNTALPEGMPGAMLAVSSDALKAKTGIVWASHPINGDANQGNVPGILQAFSADNITQELWNSNMDGARDAVGTFAKFVPPTIANGKVYLATFSNRLNVYGIGPSKKTSCKYTLPAPWKSADVGYVVYPGGVCDSSGTFTITASGDDIWNSADAFHYVYQASTGNSVEITARVKSIGDTDPWAKCGVMFRANLDAGSAYVFMAMSYGNGATFQSRLSQSAVTTNVASGGLAAPYWVRLIQTSNKYVGYVSPDGSTWTAVDSVTVALGTYPYVGLAYTTHDNSLSGEAVVDNVTTSIPIKAPDGLTTFTGQNANNKTTLLNWVTTGESGSSNYTVERSGVNTDFETLTTQAGKGSNAEANTYSFTDAAPIDGINYYRLKETDAEGNVSYSTPVMVKFNFDIVDIYPNPATTNIFIRNNNNFTNGDKVTIEVLNTLGQMVYHQTNDASDIMTVNIPSTFENGVYVVKVINAKGAMQASKIFINR